MNFYLADISTEKHIGLYQLKKMT